MASKGNNPALILDVLLLGQKVDVFLLLQATWFVASLLSSLCKPIQSTNPSHRCVCGGSVKERPVKQPHQNRMSVKSGRLAPDTAENWRGERQKTGEMAHDAWLPRGHSHLGLGEGSQAA